MTTRGRRRGGGDTRADILSAARSLFAGTGYAATTLRAVANKAGVDPALILHHFGSKDALMNQAIYEAIGDWGEEVERALTEEGVPTDDPLRRFESIMERTIASFGGPGGGLWAAQIELVSLLGHNEELRTFLASVQRDAADGLAELFLGIDPAQDPESARTAGSVLHAMFIGIMVKWFMNPKQALSAHELAEGLRIIAEHMAPIAPA